MDTYAYRVISVCVLIVSQLQLQVFHTDSFDYCTDAASVESWGMDLGRLDTFKDDESLEFYTMGDFGIIGCEKSDCLEDEARKLGLAMGSYAGDASNNGKFVLGTGDSFYQNGISPYTKYYGVRNNLLRWKLTFEETFESDSLSEMYFYNVLGNHDWDPNRKDAFDQGLDQSEWDIGTRTEIDYTSDTDLNTNKRWCLPSYYYTFSYKLKGFKVRFIALDGITMLSYDEGGCVPDPDTLETKDYCKGNNIPTKDDQLAWLESVLSSADEDYIVAFGHFPIVSAGKYGVITSGSRDFNGDGTLEELEEKCETKGFYGGYSVFSETVANLCAQYGVQLYVSGHEHNMEMFCGSYNNGNDEMLALVTGAFGKDDGLQCAIQDDIDEQYNSNENLNVDWSFLYNEIDFGFSHITIDKDGIDVQFIDSDLQLLTSKNIANANRNGDSSSSSSD